jgi:hypothetical protein
MILKTSCPSNIAEKIVSPLRVVRRGSNERRPQLNDLSCPFCGEGDFDKIGLKIHFVNGWCDIFNDTDVLAHLKTKKEKCQDDLPSHPIFPPMPGDPVRQVRDCQPYCIGINDEW